MANDQLKAIIARYTPTLRDVVISAPAEAIDRLEQKTGALPESYRDFLQWMGNGCIFLDGEELAYSPDDLLEIYEDPAEHIPEDYILIGIDKSGNSFDAHIRRRDGAVARLSEHFDGGKNGRILVESASFASYLLAVYTRTTLVPSHPFHFTAAFKGDDEQLQELWRRVDEACAHFEIQHQVRLSDIGFYGGIDFVLAIHQRPSSPVAILHFGAIERSRYEPWYDLVFARWRMLRMPQ